MVKLVVYGDFNCPYSCLASARVDRLVEQGRAEVEWRAVEHDPTIPVPSPAVNGEVAAMFDRELAEVRGLLRAGETFPVRRPPVRANTAAAIAAFASIPNADRVRRRLFAAYWFDGTDIADPAALKALGVAMHGGPDDQVENWREAWLGLGRTVVPMLVLPDGYVSRGLGALGRLTDVADEVRSGKAPGPAERPVSS